MMAQAGPRSRAGQFNERMCGTRMTLATGAMSRIKTKLHNQARWR